MQELERLLNDPDNQTAPLGDVISQVGLQSYVETGEIIRSRLFGPSRSAPTDAPIGQTVDMRLGLTMLTQTYGGTENKVVLDAQGGENRQALVIMSGQARLSDVRALLASTRLQAARREQDLTLDVPLIIWKGAQLRLVPGETLLLNRTSGAFVLNLGHIEIQRATIAVTGEINPHSAAFIPFVATAGGGSVQADQARFLGLGFGHSPKFSGFSILRNALFPARYPTHIINSFFHDFVGIAVSGVADVVIQGNNFRNARGNAVSLKQSRRSRVVSNLFSGSMPTNAIRVENGSVDSIVTGNIILGGERAGIVVRHNSDRTQVMKNIVWKRQGGGIMLAQSDCGRIKDNLVLDNAQKGVEIRNSQDARVATNLIASNHSAGIWISAQTDTTQTYINGNTLISNGSGLAAATGGIVILEGNDFSSQFPRLLSGDWAQQSRIIAGNLLGQEQIILANRKLPDTIASQNSCPDVHQTTQGEQ